MPSSTAGPDRGVLLDPARPDHVAKARDLVLGGAVIGAHFGTVFGLVAGGPKAREAIAAVKGPQRLVKPLGTLMPGAQLSGLLEPSRIDPAVRGLAMDGHRLGQTLSSLAFVRAPVRDEVADALPPYFISEVDGMPYLQSVDPGGLPGARGLMTALRRAGIEYPAATSMNDAGEPEIVDLDAAVEFAASHRLPAVLKPTHSRARAQGSLTILEFGPQALKAVRHGVIPVPVLQRLLPETPIDDTLTRQADYPSLDVPSGLLDGLSHHAQCRAALLWLGTQAPAGRVRARARLGLAHPFPGPLSA